MNFKNLKITTNSREGKENIKYLCNAKRRQEKSWKKGAK